MTGKTAGRGRYRDALRYRDMRILIASFLIDQVGSWSFVVVIAVYIFDRTHSTQWLAVLGICRWAPGLLLASYGGVIADRYERVTILITSSLVSAVLMAGMAVGVATDAPVGPDPGPGGPVSRFAGAVSARRGRADSRNRR